MTGKECVCGRQSVKLFTVNNGLSLALCPRCTYEIMVQALIELGTESYWQDLKKAVENRKAMEKK